MWMLWLAKQDWRLAPFLRSLARVPSKQTPWKVTPTCTIMLLSWKQSARCKFNARDEKDTILKIWNKYSQKRNCKASAPISTFMCLWGSAYSDAGKYVDRSREYLNRSQTHECGNWDGGGAIPFLGIHKWDFRCSAGQTEGKLLQFIYVNM